MRRDCLHTEKLRVTYGLQISTETIATVATMCLYAHWQDNKSILIETVVKHRNYCSFS